MKHCEKCKWFGGYVDYWYAECRGYKCIGEYAYLSPLVYPKIVCGKYKERKDVNTEEIKEAYKVMQKAWVELYDVEVGDIVKVLRTAKSFELGWNNTWSSWGNEKGMSKSVGRTMTISHIKRSINLNDGYNYPFFCLEFVKKAEPVIEIIVKVNHKEVPLSTLSKETILNIREKS